MKCPQNGVCFRERRILRSPGSDRVNVVFVLRSKLMKRVRSQLRSMHEQYGPDFSFNITKCILDVTGSEQAIHAVRTKMRSMIGACTFLPAPLWAELLRTRREGTTGEDRVTIAQSTFLPAPLWAELLRTRREGTTGEDRVTIAHIQSVTGCHLHVERERQEVRVTGSDGCLFHSFQLLEELASECVTVDCGFVKVSEVMLEALAVQCDVTFRLQSGKVAIFGLRDSVREAFHEVRKAEYEVCDIAPVSSSGEMWIPAFTRRNESDVNPACCEEAHDNQDSGKTRVTEEATGSSSHSQHLQVGACRKVSRSTSSKNEAASIAPLVW
eukprot:CAMPEP_0194552174 /NCGR_PEP_ID=MMETSP0253-20130528/96592_1 /TAXON_ID=2966 /ORGANISM="Noctiluca scintillans" /LENGTH=325 /DNA_ID=CAMNT_0039399639 /DNA_START=44 /DNA_END=1019 /DNA_ORIENTATION=+